MIIKLRKREGSQSSLDARHYPKNARKQRKPLSSDAITHALHCVALRRVASTGRRPREKLRHSRSLLFFCAPFADPLLNAAMYIPQDLLRLIGCIRSESNRFKRRAGGLTIRHKLCRSA